MSDLVGNPDNRFSDGSNHDIHGQCFLLLFFSSYRSKITLTHLYYENDYSDEKDIFFFFFFFFAETQVVGSR